MKNPFERNVEMLEDLLSFYNCDPKIMNGMSKEEAMITLINCMINYNEELSCTLIEDQIDDILRND